MRLAYVLASPRAASHKLGQMTFKASVSVPWKGRTSSILWSFSLETSSPFCAYSTLWRTLLWGHT